MPAPAARAREHPDMDFEPKMWGDAEFDGLGYEFDPVWFLTDEDRALEKEIIDACQRVIAAAGDRGRPDGRVPAGQR